MIPLDKLLAVKTIITHDKCPDGYASALILQDAYLAIPQKPEIRFVQYNTPAHKELKAEPGMLICDFTPPYERAPEFVAAGAIVIDHHKTAKDVVASFGELGIFGDEVTEPGICGATLAYRNVWRPLAEHRGWVNGELFIERFSHLAGIRDTWQNKHPDWYEACVQASALFFFEPEDLLAEGLQAIWRNWEDIYGRVGKVSHDRHLFHVARAVSEGFRAVSNKGTRVLAFQNSKLSSEAAEAAGDGADLVVGFDVFMQESFPVYLYSIRSHTGFDCGTFSRQNGGGGHSAAAGFTVRGPMLDPYSTFMACLNKFEGL